MMPLPEALRFRHFVLAGYDIDQGQEIKLRRAIVDETVHEPELLANLIEVSARNETALAQKIARIRALLPDAVYAPRTRLRSALR